MSSSEKKQKGRSSQKREKKAEKQKNVKQQEAVATEEAGGREEPEQKGAEEKTEETPEQAIERLKAQLKEEQDKYLRAKAELDNFRRRAQKDIASARDTAKSLTVEEFLPVFDHFQMAMDHTEQNPDFETLQQGMQMILNEFKRAFESLGIHPIHAQGKPFDPQRHEAVAQEPSHEVDEGYVIRQWKPGYVMGERLLRPATVVVSSGEPEEEEKEGEAENASAGTDEWENGS